MQSKTKQLIAILLSISSLIIILATEPFYSTKLFDWSTSAINNLQANSKPYQISIWEGYSTAGLVVASALPIVICVVMTTSQRPRAVYYVVLLSAIFFVMNVTKLAYW